MDGRMFFDTHRKQLCAKLLLTLIGTILPFALMEAVLRIHHLYRKAHSLYIQVDNPGILFVRKPRSDPEINSLGFRDYEYPGKKPPGFFRIIVLGDSVTAGYGAKVEDIFTKQLETLLNRNDRKYEVISLGMNQYSTAQEVAIFRKLGLKMSPDLVLLAYVLNDPTPDGRINDFFREDAAPSLVVDWLITKSKVFRKRPQTEIKGCKSFDYYSKMHCNAVKWAEVSDSFQELNELSAAYGFRVLVAVFPLLDNDQQARFEDYRWNAVHRQVKDEATRKGFESVDLLPYFMNWKPSEVKAAADDVFHLNKLGHEIAAKAIYGTLIDFKTSGPAQK